MTELQTALFKFVKMRESLQTQIFWPNLELNNPGSDRQTYTHRRAHMHTYTHSRSNRQTQTNTDRNAHTHAHTHTHAQTNKHKHTYTYTQARTHARTYMHSCSDRQTYAHKQRHTHTHSRSDRQTNTHIHTMQASLQGRRSHPLPPGAHDHYPPPHTSNPATQLPTHRNHPVQQLQQNYSTHHHHHHHHHHQHQQHQQQQQQVQSTSPQHLSQPPPPPPPPIASSPIPPNAHTEQQGLSNIFGCLCKLAIPSRTPQIPCLCTSKMCKNCLTLLRGADTGSAKRTARLCCVLLVCERECLTLLCGGHRLCQTHCTLVLCASCMRKGMLDSTLWRTQALPNALHACAVCLCAKRNA